MVKHLLTTKFVIVSLFITGAYLLLIILFLHSSLIKDVMLGPSSFELKMNLLISLPSATWLMMGVEERITFLLIAILTGLNFTLILQAVARLRKLGTTHLIVGGNSLLAIAGNGCLSCGLSFISLLGLSGFLVFLPFKGIELPYIAVSLLSISLYFMIKRETREQFCEI